LFHRAVGCREQSDPRSRGEVAVGRGGARCGAADAENSA